MTTTRSPDNRPTKRRSVATLGWLVLFLIAFPLGAQEGHLCHDERLEGRAWCGVVEVPEGHADPGSRTLEARETLLRTGSTDSIDVSCAEHERPMPFRLPDPIPAGERARWETPVLTEIDLDDAGERVAYVSVELGGAAPASRIVVTARDAWPGAEVGSGRMPRFRPRSTDLAFLTSGEDGTEVRVVTSSGEQRARVALDGAVSDYAWSPEGDRLALAGPGSGGVTALFIHDLESGRTRRLSAPDQRIHVDAFGSGGALDWSPDGARIAYATQTADGVEGAYSTDVFAVDVASGEVVSLVERPGLDLRPRWSPDGQRVAFATSFGGTNRFGRHGVALLHVESGDIADVGVLDETFLEAPTAHLWSSADEALLVPAARGVSTGLLRRNAGGQWDTLIGGEGRTVASPRIDAAGRRLAFLTSEPGLPWSIRVLDLVTGSESAVGGPAPLAPSPRWEVLRWTNIRGDTLQGLLFHPEPAGTDAPAPLVTWLHGGPDGRVSAAFDPAVPFPTVSFDPLPLFGLLRRGYAVFMPNHRASAGYPAQVRMSVAGRYVEVLEEDVLSGLRVLVARGVADPRRLMLGGWASGGMAVTQLLTRTDEFTAAVSGAANTSLEAAYGDGDFPSQWHSLMGGAPWERRDAWDRASPLRQAESIRTPLLLLHGGADPLVPVAQSRYLHTFLEGLGRVSALEILDGVGHGIVLPTHRERSARLMLDWFDARARF